MTNRETACHAERLLAQYRAMNPFVTTRELAAFLPHIHSAYPMTGDMHTAQRLKLAADTIETVL